jgi:2-polyprenyl-3-methyl-5-hydroxy-6-metoxy-1,4-benzoquinol methylase
MNHRKKIYSKYVSNYQSESRDVLYEMRVNRWGQAYEHYFKNWLPPDKDADIVDLACGGGRLLHFFKVRGYTNLSGVDTSPEQVALAGSVVDTIYRDDIINFLKKNLGVFNLITGIDIIEHLTKDEAFQFLKNCYNALKPGGRLILQTPNADSPFFPSMFNSDLTHEIGFDVHSLRNLLQHIGFTRVEPRETGPIPIKFGLITGFRQVAWKLIRLVIMAYNLIEMGNAGNRIYTRVFLISAVKK